MERDTEKRSEGTLGDLARGQTLAGYRIEALVGGGVYRASDVDRGRTVALKVGVGSPVVFDHPHVVAVYEAGEYGGRPFVAMRWIAGTDLRELIARTGGLDPRRAARIAAQVGEALDAAHRRGLVHGNVKPSNVLIEDRDRADHACLSAFGRGAGPNHYAAPEGRAADARADVYALGCVLFEALTGAVPDGPSARALRAELPPEIDAVLSRAMAPDPKRRYPSAGDLGRAALATLAGSIVAAPVRSIATGPAAPPPSEPHAPPALELPTAAAHSAGPRPPTVVYAAPWNAAAQPGAVFATPMAADDGAVKDPFETTVVVQDSPAATTSFWADPHGPSDAPTRPATSPPADPPAPAGTTSRSSADRPPEINTRERPRRRHLRPALIAGAAAVLVAAGAIAAGGGEDHDPGRAVPRPAGSEVRIHHVDLGPRAAPGHLVADRDTAYVIDKAAGRIVSVDAASAQVAGSVDLGAAPAALIRDPYRDRLWVSICGGRDSVAAIRTDHGRMIGGAPVRVRRKPNRIAVLPNGQLAVLSRRDDGASLTRIDGRTRRGVGRPTGTGGATTDVVAGGPGLVVGTAFPPALTTYSPKLAELRTIKLDFDGTPTRFAVSGSTAWVVFAATVLFPAGDEKSGDPLPGTVARLNLASGEIEGTPIAVGRGASDIAIDGGVVWVANKADGTVTRIDEKTGRSIGRPIEVGPIGGRLAAANGTAWVTGERDLIRLTPV